MRQPGLPPSLTDELLLFERKRGSFTAYRTAAAIPQLAYIQFQLSNRAAQSIAVHAELTCGFALVAAVLLQNIHDEALFELTYGLRVKNAAAIHLRYESFKLVLHEISLSFQMRPLIFCLLVFSSRARSASQFGDSLTKLLANIRRREPACAPSS